jgi:hypothetical protein
MKRCLVFLLLASVVMISFYPHLCQAAATTDSTSLVPPAVNAMTQKLTVDTSKSLPYTANPNTKGDRTALCPRNMAPIQVNNHTPQLYLGPNLWVERKDLPPDFLMNQPSVLSGVYCAPVENVWIQK